MTETGCQMLQILAADEQLLSDLRADAADVRAMNMRERMAFLVERLRPLAEKHRLSLSPDDLSGPLPDDALASVTGGLGSAWGAPILELLFGERR